MKAFWAWNPPCETHSCAPHNHTLGPFPFFLRETRVYILYTLVGRMSDRGKKGSQMSSDNLGNIELLNSEKKVEMIQPEDFWSDGFEFAWLQIKKAHDRKTIKFSKKRLHPYLYNLSKVASAWPSSLPFCIPLLLLFSLLEATLFLAACVMVFLWVVFFFKLWNTSSQKTNG